MVVGKHVGCLRVSKQDACESVMRLVAVSRQDGCG
jgi:hypothetical protein